jgi:type I restriction enzyme M protein
MNNFQDKANFNWQVADDILRGTFKNHEYGDIILPFVVLRRLDCVLEPKKDDVIKTHKEFKNKLDDLSQLLLQATGSLNFHNTSCYDLRRLTQDGQPPFKGGNLVSQFVRFIQNNLYLSDVAG